MTVRDTGERTLVRMLESLVRLMPGSRLSFDEDASDVPLECGQSVVANVDTFVQSKDRLPHMTDAQMGRKTAVMVLSDIVAKGARPMATMLSLCVPDDYPVNGALEAVRGFSDYCLKNGVHFLGGDLGSSSELILTGVAIGTAYPDLIVTRKGSSVGDLVAVTGLFGLTSVGFHILLRNIPAPAELRNSALEAVYKPELSFGLVEQLSARRLITSCMDCSDGLGISLNIMSEQSGHEFLVERLPVAPGVDTFAQETGLSLLDLVMNGGEEFLLVMTIPREQLAAAQTISAEYRTPLHVIGRVCDSPARVRLVADGTETVIPARGYDNFLEWS
ncbi:MAG: thiamine-phosphate kinase [Candidatus Thorarchaeota archaeon]